MKYGVVVLVCVASCAVRAPAPVDVDRLLAARGPAEARRDLEIRVTSDPRDVAGRLALAELDERIGRPSESIDALEAVAALGGPIGVRWHDGDRARLARLIAARGRARLARGAASALADLERAKQLGAAIADSELAQARAAGAIVALRHSDAETRASGRRTLAELTEPRASGAVAAAAATTTNASNPSNASVSAADPAAAPNGTAREDLDAWRGARADATPDQRARFGVWLWAHGARRAAWDELAAWHAVVPLPRDPVLQDAYLTAARWWMPFDRPAPPAAELTEAWRCAFAPCAPREVAGDELREHAFALGPQPSPVRDPADAAALALITLHQALRGEVAWGAALAARVDLAAFASAEQLHALPRYVQPIFARLTGLPVPSIGDAGAAAGAAPDERLVIAAERLLAGDDSAESLALVAGSAYADALHRVAGLPADAPPGGAAAAQAASLPEPAAASAVSPNADAFAKAAVRGVAAALSRAPLAPLCAIVLGYRRDPDIADRLGRDLVAAAADAAEAHAWLGALFDALGDPARAREAWQAAVDGSPEPAFLSGLAEAEARQGDGDAALIATTTAAAASGDPGAVWASAASALAGSGRYVHALEAARSAVDLAGPESLAEALDAASLASHALGRDAQAAALTDQRSRVSPGHAAPNDRDPTDPRMAVDAYRRDPSDTTLARLVTAARWNPRDISTRAVLRASLPVDDPRRLGITNELVDLASDRDAGVRRAAVAALR